MPLSLPPARPPQSTRRRLLVGACGATLLGAAGPLRAQPARGAPVRMGGTGAGLVPLRRLFESAERPLHFVPNLGSGGGLKALAAGAVDIALSARRLSDAERASGLVERELMHTPFLWAVHAGVPLERVTMSQLAALYGGQLERWANGLPVRLVLRPESDSDWRYMRSLTPGLAQALAAAGKRPGLKLAITDEDSATDIERIAGALGSCSLALVAGLRVDVRVLPIDGVAPDLPSMIAGRYPYRKTIHLVTRPGPSAEVAAMLRLLAARATAESLARLGCQSVFES